MEKVNKFFSCLFIVLLIISVTSCPSFNTAENRVDEFFEANFIQFQTQENNFTKEFLLSDIEVTYGLWYQVYTWATELNGHYTFANKGDEGYEKAGYFPENGNLPVCGINYRDAIVWCNAASEKAGFTPVYYLSNDFQLSNVIRDAHYSDATPTSPEIVEVGEGYAENAYVNKEANGYRLPTKEEWLNALKGEGYKYKIDEYNINEKNICDFAVCNGSPRVEEVKSRKSIYGLYDMYGNVSEWCYSEKVDLKPVMGGDFYTSKEKFFLWDSEEVEPICTSLENCIKTKDQDDIPDNSIDNPDQKIIDDREDYTEDFISIPIGFRLARSVIKK